MIMLSDLFINGRWRKPVDPGGIDVFNPATGEVIHSVAAGSAADVDLAVKAAHDALPGGGNQCRGAVKAATRGVGAGFHPARRSFRAGA